MLHKWTLEGSSRLPEFCLPTLGVRINRQRRVDVDSILDDFKIDASDKSWHWNENEEYESAMTGKVEC